MSKAPPGRLSLIVFDSSWFTASLGLCARSVGDPRSPCRQILLQTDRSAQVTRATWKSITLPPKSDRKSTRLNSSHLVISYAVFCLKKKKHRLTGAGQHGARDGGGRADGGCAS